MIPHLSKQVGTDILKSIHSKGNNASPVCWRFPLKMFSVRSKYLKMLLSWGPLSLAHLSSSLCVSVSVSPTYFPCASFLPFPCLTIHPSSYSCVFQGITPADCRKWEQMNRDSYPCCHVLWNICCIGKYSQLQRSRLKLTIAERVLWEDKGCHIWENDQCWLAPVSEPFLWVWHVLGIN